ncbi:tripartite tricarboxylate transporter TctB family protein [Methylobacterium planeticum]|uniref:Tripartite tricarboxylate transporter TctB family protein n=1 Tax=Methylobacterium planeticum TaxID=2615211 RepID=A0A6N6MN32_9HYPH|nr:tripartite tricarboxylate transporter TctB family protein [Methylobacterium planeticum]KAB1072662.1 tripartite tricarboxylate transporter TctB family protein [Methylobacterium planeticum]
MDEPLHGSGHTRIRGPQPLAAGLGLVGLGLLGVWAGSDLPQGSMRAMGPGFLPRWLSVGITLCGLALAASGLLRDGQRLPSIALRGPAVVMLAILAFALTIRPVAVGPLTTPGLGLIVAGPLAILLAGYASPEARFRELVILALFLTAGCMLLFGDLLNLPIPIFPAFVLEALSGSVSPRLLLRAVAAGLGLTGLGLLAIGRGTRRRAVDVVPHSITT